MSDGGWVGVDLDGTLVHYEFGGTWFGPGHIGPPLEPMVRQIRQWLDAGLDVRIFTARVSSDGSPRRDSEAQIARLAIEVWCEKNIGVVLPITCTKDYHMLELWDDRAVTVAANIGIPVARSSRGLDTRPVEEQERGTVISAYAEDGPYHCEDCVHMTDSICHHSLVVLDPEMADRREGDGVRIDPERGCCRMVNVGR